MKMNRRSLLAAMGLAGGAYFLPSLLGAPSGSARAQATPVPRRILFFFTLQGTMKSRWAPTGPGGAGAPQERAFELGNLHTPLQPHKGNLVFLDGLGMDQLDQISGSARDGHTAGGTLALTAAKRANPSAGGGISIDEHIAKGLAAKGIVRPFEALVLGAGTPFGEMSSTYLGSNNQVPISTNPAAVFARIMPKIPASGAPDPEATKRLARQKSVLDFASRDFDAASARASSVDRARLQTHADAIRDLEKRLAVSGVGAACTAPSTAVGASYVDQVDAHMRIVQTAFACDLTRVATLYLDVPQDAGLWGLGGVGPDTFHTEYIHQADRGDVGKDNAVAAYHRFIAGQLAKMLANLKAITEPDGTTMLDNTIVVWCNQLGGGNDHSLSDMPFVLAGGKSSGFATGRYLKYANRPHNDLYASLAGFMGVPTPKFGEQSIGSGPLANL